MRKFSAFTIAVAITAVFLFIVGGTVAYFFASTSNIVNTFVPGKVECQVVENFADNVKTNIQVKNTGTTAAYMRVCLTTYWVENYTDDQNKAATRVVGRDADIPTFTLGADWALGADGFYYYKKPVDPNGALTDNLLGTSTMTLATDGSFAQVVEVFAEAIQSVPDAAVIEAWGTDNGGSVSKVNNGVLEVTPAS